MERFGKYQFLERETGEIRDLGNDIDVQVDAESDEIIASVFCTLNNLEFASDDLRLQSSRFIELPIEYANLAQANSTDSR